MKGAPLNIFQKLMRRWDTEHPYNAAQVMKIQGSPDRAAVESAWHGALARTGLGTVAVESNRYRFISLNGHAAAYTVGFSNLSLNDHLSAEMNRPFSNPDEPPFRPFVIVGQNHFFAGVVYQHWLADSASIRMLNREWFVGLYDCAAADTSKLKLAKSGYWDAVGPNRGGWEVTQSILDMTRRHIRMRRVQKIDSAQLSNHDTRFMLVPGKAGLIDHVCAAARRRKVKVNDIFLAALAESCSHNIPMQARHNRRDLAVGSVVDLRPYSPLDLTRTFGLFLGFTNVICQPAELQDFDRLLRRVARQTQLQKETGVAPASLIWICAAWVVGMLSKPGELYKFYRKELPLAGGISNVDLSRTWAADYHPTPLLDYIRISPTGPMTPLVMTTTTLGDQFHLGITYRTGLISAERAEAAAATFLARLESLV